MKIFKSAFVFFSLSLSAHAQFNQQLLRSFSLKNVAGIGIHKKSDQKINACDEFKKSLPSDVKQNYIDVPENWSNPQSKKIKVFYYYRDFKLYPETSKPVVFFNGGPGSDSHGSYTTLLKRKEFQSIPFIFIDQRGNGCSTPYPYAGPNSKDIARIKNYGTRAIVNDAEAIRRALMLKKTWGVFGQSYGGYIAYRYSILFPHSLNHVFIHGSSLMDDGIKWTEDRMIAQRRAGLEYLKVYPGDEEIVNRAKAQFPDDLCYRNFAKDPVSGKKVFVDEACGKGLIDDRFYGILSIGRNYWDRIHSRVGALLDVNGIIDPEFLKQFSADNLIESSDAGRTYNMFIGNTRDVPGGLALNWACQAAYKNLIKKGYDPKSWLFSECYSELTWKFGADSFLRNEFMRDYITIKDLKNALKQNSKLKMHVYSSHLDGYVAEESFSEMVKRLGSLIQYTNFKESGHGGWFFEDKVYEDILVSF